MLTLISCSGHVAERSLNFISLEPTISEPARGTKVDCSEVMKLDDNSSAQFAERDDDVDGEKVRILQQPESRCVITMGIK